MKRFYEMLKDENRPVKERSFLLLSSVALTSLFIAFIGGIALRECIEDILALGIGFVVFFLFTIFAYKTQKLEEVSFISSLLIIFLLLPVTFFAGGGINGGSPLWFVFCTMFISMLIEGKKKIILLTFDCLVALSCYVVAYFHPEYVIKHESGTAYLDSFVSLISVTVMLSIMVGFEIWVMKKEKEHSDRVNREIESINQSQSRFFTSLSHEIRTPINTIIGLNEMILREDVSDEINEDAVNIKAASRMLLHLINEILDMSKFESGEMKINPTPYNTGDMLSDVVGMVWLRAKEKHLEFKVDVDPSLPQVLIGDEVRIKQILINLLTNAIKYTQSGSVRLQIQCERKEGNIANVIYTVSDTGMGIKKESLPYLFDAFKRVDEEKNRFIEGTGLGLAIVKQFVDLMGGKITVNSVYSRGSTFITEIPQPITDDSAIGEINVEKRKSDAAHSHHVTSFEAPKARLLVVDDTEPNLMVVEKLLRDTKITIDSVTSGREALSKTLDNYYDVIFMDHMMPEMDGIQCLHGIRKQIGGLSRSSKVVVLTANAGNELNDLYEQEGFDGYIVKPVTGEDLEKELFRLLPKELVLVTGTEEELKEESTAWVREHRKKRNVAITTESVADLPKDLLEEYGIAVIPHMIRTEGGLFKDVKEVESRGLLSYMRDPDAVVETIPPGVEEHETFFSDQLQLANNIIHISLSGRVSHSGYPAAMEAASNFDNVFVVDSQHLSGGLGLLAVEGARLAAMMKTPEEITDALMRMRDRIHTSFIVNDINYLVRAGQVREGIANMAKAFMIRPVISLKRGKMRIGGAHIGTRERVFEKYIKAAFRGQSVIDKRILLVNYVGLSRKELNRIKEIIDETIEFERVFFQKGSPSVSVNSGPGAFGLMFITKYTL